MNQRLVYIAGSVLAAALFLFAIWHATQRKPEQASAIVPAASRIEPDDLYAHFQKHDVTIIDVRDAEAFAASHIPGALNIPLARVDSEVSSLPKGKPIVAYCT